MSKRNYTTSVEVIKSHLAYEPLTGKFIRIVSTSNRSPVGTVAGNKNADGGIRIKLKGETFRGEHVAWMFMTGEWPEEYIHHLNGDTFDNRWLNLQCHSALIKSQKVDERGIEWRPITWAYGYEISEIGELASWKPFRKFATPPIIRRIGAFKLDKNGYHEVSLHTNSGLKSFKVHRLVCEFWHGVDLAGSVVRHIDGSKDNNHYSNLAWGTVQQNHDDMLLHGTRKTKLSKDEAVYIKFSKELGKVLSDKFNIAINTVSNIRTGKTWKHLDN